jgi:hypothetical protein
MNVPSQNFQEAQYSTVQYKIIWTNTFNIQADCILLVSICWWYFGIGFLFVLLGPEEFSI